MLSFGAWATLSILAVGATGSTSIGDPLWKHVAPTAADAQRRTTHNDDVGYRVELAEQHSGPPVIVDVNRPRSPLDCDLPMGVEWYGSRERCLQYLCGGRNVYNEYFFDSDNRRRKNPCYGQSPTDFGERFD